MLALSNKKDPMPKALFFEEIEPSEAQRLFSAQNL
jgi:hypothetical protein